ncbi:hypothetical protein [Roseicella aerolata]|uniref:Uncharacterized protein n=1 Tax=Roseicella aerolata TaxID=2883479 RepID=A0A9X1L6H2_9PROT|nr:hypothetical protein [Roseicella aerolata]MCB4820569.1 hypothetical protein [Roseicella aerolata]
MSLSLPGSVANLRPASVLGHVSAACVTVLAMAIAASFLLKDDVAWLLYVAEQWLDGRRPYVALIEINPPLIIWLSVLPAAIARILNVPSLLTAPLFFATLLLGCVWWAAGILQLRDRRYDRSLTFAIVSAVLLLAPGVEFWQREHLIAAAALPYLALRVGERAEKGQRKAAFRTTAFLAGVLVGFCCAMKPWYVLPFVLVEWVAVAGGARFLREAVLGACTTGLLYVAAVAMLHPEYLTEVIPLALDLYNSGDRAWHEILTASRRLPMALAAAALLWWIAPRPLPDGGATRILLVFAIGATIAYLLQGKGYWYYQRIPAVVAVLLVLLSLVAALLRDPSLSRFSAGRLVLCFVAAIAFLGLAAPGAFQLKLMAQGVAATPAQRIQAHLVEVLRSSNARSYLAFSSSLELGFPIVNQTGVVWASRFPSTWALYKAHSHSPDDESAKNVSRPVVRWFIEDFTAVCPDIVAVDTRDRMDYLSTLQGFDAGFAQDWDAYRLMSSFEGIRIYGRIRPASSVNGCG